MTTKTDTLKSLVDRSLDQRLPKTSTLAGPLIEVMRYSVLGGGKRLRPLLTLTTCAAAGGQITDAMDAACAIEFVHAYSLIHDDLPAMDNDELRHGQATAHIKFNESQAILAGDALQTLAFQVISDSHTMDDPTKLQVLRCLSIAIGWSGMAGGQSMDMALDGLDVSMEDIQSLHQAKTGALIKASVEIGAISSQKIKFGSSEFQALSEFGAMIGFAFQIVDDLLDVTETTDQIGKPSLSDQRNQKTTIANFLNIEEVQRLANKTTDQAIALLDRTTLNTESLKNLALECAQRNH